MGTPSFSSCFTCPSPAPTRLYPMGADHISDIADNASSLLHGATSGAQQRVLSEYIKNPFLDDDVQALALRTGIARQELAPILAGLRDAGLLQSAGRRGHMLNGEQLAAPMLAQEVVPLVDAGDVVPAAPAWAPLLEALPGGVALLDLRDRSVQANALFYKLLGLSSDAPDADEICVRLGCDVMSLIDDLPLVLAVENDLEVQLRPCQMANFDGIVATVNSVDPTWEVSKAQVQIQEDLYAQLRDEVAGPADFLQAFLEKPKKSELGQARAAIERINACLSLFLLNNPSDEDSVA